MSWAETADLFQAAAKSMSSTLPKNLTDIAPGRRPRPQKETHLRKTLVFQVRAVSFREGRSISISQMRPMGCEYLLVGGFNPSEKYDRQIGSFPQVGVKTKNIWNHHPVYHHFPLVHVAMEITVKIVGKTHTWTGHLGEKVVWIILKTVVSSGWFTQKNHHFWCLVGVGTPCKWPKFMADKWRWSQLLTKWDPPSK